jgi:hypothetical protein
MPSDVIIYFQSYQKANLHFAGFFLNEINKWSILVDRDAFWDCELKIPIVSFYTDSFRETEKLLEGSSLNSRKAEKGIKDPLELPTHIIVNCWPIFTRSPFELSPSLLFWKLKCPGKLDGQTVDA